jgi:hypothetical protein
MKGDSKEAVDVAAWISVWLLLALTATFILLRLLWSLVSLLGSGISILVGSAGARHLSSLWIRGSRLLLYRVGISVVRERP